MTHPGVFKRRQRGRIRAFGLLTVLLLVVSACGEDATETTEAAPPGRPI